MELEGKKLGLLVSAPPESRNFLHALHLAEAALQRGVTVYLYLIDEAVTGLPHQMVTEAMEHGVKLFACAYSLQRRNLSLETTATLAGLTLLADIIHSSDRFLAFQAR